MADWDSADGETTFGPSQESARPVVEPWTTTDPGGIWRASSMLESPTDCLRPIAEVD